VTGDGLYTIAPLETPSSGAQVLRIPRDVDSMGNVLASYYVEFRQPYGFDDNTYVYNGTCGGTQTCASHGVLMHLSPPSSLLDATPGTSGFTDAALLVGRTMEDPIKGISVTTRSISASGASVEVRFGPVVCTPANPGISINPFSRWGFAGDSLGYDVTLRNNNAPACPAASFDIVPALPEGWSQEPASLNLSLASGGSTTVSVNVTSAADTPPGFYGFSETALDAVDARYATSGSATLNIQPPDATPPAVTITSPSSGALLPRKGLVKIAANASDASGIGRIELMVDGVSLKVCSNTSSCAANWSMKGVVAGAHTITAVAKDKGMPAPNTAGASITLVKP
jgi:hypothetical protein